MGEAPLLDVRDLVTAFKTDDGIVRAVDGVSFSVNAGGVLGVVGESGCGKSVTAMSILRLVASPPGFYERGNIFLRGRDLLDLPESDMRAVRGKEIAMIFQDPMTSLNPVFTVGDQIAEAVRLHKKLSRAEARARAIEMLRLVNIPSPETRVDDYPHQLSGGMRQRVMIAMALSCEPALLIADEPTTALDVTVQAQILELLARLRKELGMAIMLITHDLGVVSEFADEVVVMYAGRVVERTHTRALFESPLHPYTQGLLASLPGAHVSAPGERVRLKTIGGVVPDLAHLPPGCRFQTRCSRVIEDCKKTEPQLREVRPGHLVACIRADEEVSA